MNVSRTLAKCTDAYISMVALVARCVERDGSTSRLTSFRPQSAGTSASLERAFLTSSSQSWRFSEIQLSSATCSSSFHRSLTHSLILDCWYLITPHTIITRRPQKCRLRRARPLAYFRRTMKLCTRPSSESAVMTTRRLPKARSPYRMSV
jgi:hypothetical protein